ncbi:sensor histidine kinase [Gracilibacillus salinarum]|uniref:histidine kinase n=1 Tax=Gracilibacillus salinarum TaxID=2932255 RepID=A0ABY4GL33_9BACI|nr:HAMP domain-containing sensor histidine kinase [Gracilibacillus salinarum]UOQ84939.1 HAMP domain-containing histidine kinase [Gracilibacillus salinarum]
MSIKKRLLLSNIAMIVVPVIGFLLIEILLGYLFFIKGEGAQNEQVMQSFMNYRLAALILVLIVTNGLLTYFVSRTIIKPIQQLRNAAGAIKQGNLNDPIKLPSNDELGELANTMEEMRESLQMAKQTQEKYETNRRELIASISHDLRTPITSIKGYVQGVLDGVADTEEKHDRYMRTIYNKTEALEYMVDELFVYSKLDLQRMPFHFETIDLVSYCHDIMEELRFQYPQIDFVFQQSGRMTNIEADREQLHRAILNVVTNSVKYQNNSRSKIIFSITEKEENVILMIKDNGIGIDQAAVPFVFDQFYRTDSSRNSATGGSGLGLAIVKKIIEIHQGTVWAESEPGIGTTIYFQLKKGEHDE